MSDNDGASGSTWGNINAAAGGASGPLAAAIQAKMARTNAREQMAFQREMSNTAFQRQTVDLQKAGLNRILGYAKGSGGASTPPGAMAMAPEMQLGGAVATAQAAKGWYQEQKNMRAAENKDDAAAFNSTQAGWAADAAKNLSDANAAYTNVNTALAELRIPEAEKRANFWDTRHGTAKIYGEAYLPMLRDAGLGIGGLLTGIRLGKPKPKNPLPMAPERKIIRRPILLPNKRNRTRKRRR